MQKSGQEKRAEATIRAIQLGQSVRSAAIRFGVPRTYLQRRIDGIPTRKETQQSFEAISPYLEAQLVHCAVGQARLGFAPSLVKFQAVTQNMLQASSKKTLVNGATAANIHLFFD
ncbi:hypothetical protein F4824DRAFT_155351 [Ustulina deusta]|nr:hypothetical protein F4824DRAFT_155351 [Ustulina deusta]